MAIIDDSKKKKKKKRSQFKIGDAVVVRNELPAGELYDELTSEEREWHEKRARWRRGIVVAFDGDAPAPERIIGDGGIGRPIVLLNGQKSWNMFSTVKLDPRTEITHNQLLRLGLRDPSTVTSETTTANTKMPLKSMSKVPITRPKSQAECMIEAQRIEWAKLPKPATNHEQILRNVCQSAGLAPSILKQRASVSPVCDSECSAASSVSSTSRSSVVHHI